MAQQQGLSQNTVASDLLVSLSSSGQAAPNYWLDPKSGVQYIMAVQTPQYKKWRFHPASLQSTPVTTGASGNPRLRGKLAEGTRGVGPGNVTLLRRRQPT